LRVRLKKDRDKSLRRRHPWVFSGAVAGVEGDPGPGDTVAVLGAEGQDLGLGAWSPASQMRVRMWSFDPAEAIDPAFFRRRIQSALTARNLPGAPAGCRRLINAESDGLPGVVADAYGPWVVLSLLSAGAERWREEIALALSEATGCRGVYERSDSPVRAREGLPERAGLVLGEEPPELVEIAEGPARFLVDLRRGHKTGFYLDQRENRRLVSGLADGRDVLNCFSYTGGFGIAALLGGAARCLSIDTSAEALALAAKNARLNELSPEAFELREADVFHELRTLRDQGRSFGLAVLDPPKFAESQASLPAATRGYKDINLMAMRLLAPGGLLCTFSCSGLVSPDLFQKIVAGAALDSGRTMRIIGRFTQPPDHPVAPAFPEGEYLKGLLLRGD